MNDLQRKSLELLIIFLSICEKWNIPYYLVCGSALGAMKYGGFIPWDDDIDVGLLRADYNRFLEIAPGELPDWCFLQNYKTEKYFPQTYSKLRNVNTTFIEKENKTLPINHGIYIDIFPLDGYPMGRAEQIAFELKRKVNAWWRYSVYENSLNTKVKIRNKFLRLMGLHNNLQKAHKYVEKLYTKYPPAESELWCNFGNWQGRLEYVPRWQYGNGAWGTFEGLRVRVPEKYDEYLTQKYGDWRSDPPLEQQKSHHNSITIDVNRSYRYYMTDNEIRDINSDLK